MKGLRDKTAQTLGLIAFTAALAACQPSAGPAPRAGAEAHPDLAFAQSSCGGCHAVDRRSVSPNPQAPPFARIVNQQGLTRNTLAAWLRDAHNYPGEMNFTLGQREVDRIAAFMLTLRDPTFRPEI